MQSVGLENGALHPTHVSAALAPQTSWRLPCFVRTRPSAVRLQLSCADHGWVQVRLLQKKVSAVGSTADGEWALAADKFGDVYVAPLRSAAHASASDSAADPDAASSDAAVANGQQHGDATHDGDAAAAPQAASAAGSKPALLLGHYNATITSLTVTADGSSLVSTDRDGKARVSVLPSHPLQVRTPARVTAASPECPTPCVPADARSGNSAAVRLRCR